MMKPNDMSPEVISQTENFVAWRVEEPDDETTYHLDINNLTVHFFQEEWDEFLTFKNLLPEIEKKTTGIFAETNTHCVDIQKLPEGEMAYAVELTGATIYFIDEDWDEFLELVKNL